MTSGLLIREARLRAGLSQHELAERSGRERSVIARWEQGAVSPSFETLHELVRACGYDFSVALVPLESDAEQEARLRQNLLRSPQERLQGMLRARKS